MQFVCLANSFKEGGRCLAGIELKNGNPIMQNNQPKWVRPVCETIHGEVPTHLVQHIRLLDIVEIEVTNLVPDGYQSENVLFNTDSIQVVGSFALDAIPNLRNYPQNLFGNRGKAVSHENIAYLNHSLVLVEVTAVNVYEKTYQDNNKVQVRMIFSFNGTQYDLPVTDPVFLNQYRNNHDLLIRANRVFLVISLGISHQDWHYKLVAGVFHL